MPVTIKRGGLKFRDASSGEYIDVDVVGERKTSEQIADIEAAGAAERSAIQTKGEQTRASIPADYTDLSDSVGDLKSALSNVETLSDELGLSWVIGGLANNGTENANTNRIRTGFTSITNVTSLKCTIETGYSVNILRFDATKTQLATGGYSGWISGPLTVNVDLTGLGYVRLAMKRSDDGNMSTSEGSNAVLVYSNELLDNNKRIYHAITEAENDISEAVSDSNTQIADIRNIITSFENLESDKIPYIYQFLDETDITEGYYYSRVPDNESGVPTLTAHNTFFIYDPVTLYPGQYTILNTISASISYVVADGKCKPASTYFNIDSSYSGDVTVTETIQLYITINKNTSTKVRIVNKNDFIGIAIPYTSGLAYGKLNPVIDFSFTPDIPTYYDQAFIKNGELTCYNDHKTDNNTVAKYTQVDMGSDVVKIMCSGYFKDSNNNGSITLIATALNSYSNVGNIIYGSLHIGFSPGKMAVQIFINRSLTTIQEYNYTTVVNTEYTFGWSISGDTITVYLPDGTTQTVTDERFADLNGRYMIFEHYKATSNTGTPTDDFGQPVITGIYCECASGTTLRDNFKRADGAPNVAPTGHVYSQYRNSSYIEANDTIFVNHAGSVNN